MMLMNNRYPYVVHRIEVHYFWIIVLTIISFLLISNQSYALTIHSTQTGDVWEDKRTWVEGIIPTKDDHVVINAEVLLRSEKEVSSIHINSSGSLHSSSSWQRKLKVEQRFENHGLVGSNVPLSLSSDLINTGNINANVHLNGGEQSIIGDVNILTLGGDVTLSNSLNVKKLYPNNFTITMQDPERKWIRVGEVIGNLHTNASVSFDCKDDQNQITKQRGSFRAKHLVYHCTHEFSQRKDYDLDVDTIEITKEAQLTSSGPFRSTIITDARIVNRGTIENINIVSLGDIDTRLGVFGPSLLIKGGGERTFLGSFPYINVQGGNLKLRASLNVDRLSSNDNRIDFLNDTDRIIVRLLHDEIQTNGNVVFSYQKDDHSFSKNYRDIQAKTIVIEGVHKLPNNQTRNYHVNELIILEGAELHPEHPRWLATMNITGDVINKGIIFNNVRLNTYGSIENTGTWNGRPYLFWPDSGEEDYVIQMKSESSDFQSRTVETNTHQYDVLFDNQLYELINTEQKRYWRVRLGNGEWSETFMFNGDISSEHRHDNTSSFFDLSFIPDLEDGEDVTLNITAKESDYNGFIYVESEQGVVSPHVAYMRNGYLSVNLSLARSSYQNRIQVSSKSGSAFSNKFTVGQERFGAVFGSVQGYNMSNLVVTLVNDNYSYHTETDNRGEFAIHQVICGTYAIEVTGMYNSQTLQSSKETVEIPCGTSTKHMVKTVIRDACNLQEKIPVLLIPGILGTTTTNRLSVYPHLPRKRPSWDDGSLTLHNIFVGGSENNIFDYVGWEKIVSALEEKGYERNCTLFEVPYYWADSAQENVQNYLKNVIDHAKRVSGEDQVSIIAHSMGGIVTRSYVQSDAYDGDILKIFLLGTPNHGSVLAYSIWAYGDVIAADGGYHFDKKLLSPATFFYTNSLRLFVKEKIGSSPCVLSPGSYLHQGAWNYPLYCDNEKIKDFVHRFVPGLQDLLPVYPEAIVDAEGENYAYHKNSWLDRLNQSFDAEESFLPDITILAGTEKSTIRTLVVNHLGFVVDKTMSILGDGTVFHKGSDLSGIEVITKKGSHSRLPHHFMSELAELINDS